jgi:hypothetical protein
MIAFASATSNCGTPTGGRSVPFSNCWINWRGCVAMGAWGEERKPACMKALLDPVNQQAACH